MKWTTRLAPTLLGLSGLVAARAYVCDGTLPVMRTEVLFYEPEKFTDVGDRDTLQELRDYLIQQASRIIPATLRFQVAILNVDRAGAYDSFDNVRVVRDLYPPRISLLFRVIDADGLSLREGRRDLIDLAFMSRLVMDQHDPLHYEKMMIDDWLQTEFKAWRSKKHAH